MQERSVVALDCSDKGWRANLEVVQMRPGPLSTDARTLQLRFKFKGKKKDLGRAKRANHEMVFSFDRPALKWMLADMGTALAKNGIDLLSQPGEAPDKHVDFSFTTAQFYVVVALSTTETVSLYQRLSTIAEEQNISVVPPYTTAPSSSGRPLLNKSPSIERLKSFTATEGLRYVRLERKSKTIARNRTNSSPLSSPPESRSVSPAHTECSSGRSSPMFSDLEEE